ncbi:uncharacterized protein LOC134183332 [Corticium candelabrum]|uniref:uncharacterized protein LOC134183332 n=1 Tax=Corticium candelabrum TaxID=121492 RepID=UPI002E276C91|nr:uncharacterized protein LOC134183332 [Corticium candelabrum]
MTPIERTVVFIGRTGAGKSTCANALASAILFPESDQSVSETKFIESRTVNIDGANSRYRVKIVDTIGIGDTDLEEDEVLKRLASACYECREGINAVFFVTGGRFTQEEADAWDVIWKVLFSPAIVDHTTIVRTRFPKFLDPTAVKSDCDRLKAQKVAGKKIIEQIKEIIHVDNPPQQYPGWEETRQKSRATLLTHLDHCEAVYKPQKLDEINKRISEHVEKKQAAEIKLQTLLVEFSQTCEQLNETKKKRDKLEEAKVKSLTQTCDDLEEIKAKKLTQKCDMLEETEVEAPTRKRDELEELTRIYRELEVDYAKLELQMAEEKQKAAAAELQLTQEMNEILTKCTMPRTNTREESMLDRTMETAGRIAKDFRSCCLM